MTRMATGQQRLPDQASRKAPVPAITSSDARYGTKVSERDERPPNSCTRPFPVFTPVARVTAVAAAYCEPRAH